MKADVVIVGSGISGLTAAAILAKKNKKIIILESHRRPGGALKRFTRKGIPFDVGFHYTGCLGDGEILNSLWQYLGVLPSIKVSQFPKHGCDLLNIHGMDRQVHCYFSYEMLVHELCSIFPEDAKAVIEHFKTIKEICDNIPFYNLDMPLAPFLRNFFDQGQNFGKYLNSITQNTYLQAVLASPAFLYGVPPIDVGLITHASVSHGFHAGAYSINGGGQAIVDAYLDVLDGLGVEILTSAEVELIKTDNGLVKGVFTKDTEIETSSVIYTGHPGSLLNIVPENEFRPAYRHRLEDLKNTGSMFVVFGSTDNADIAQKLKWSNYYSLDAGLNFLDVNFEDSSKNSILMTSPGLRDYDTTLPEDQFPVILMRPAMWDEVANLTSFENRQRTNGYLEWKKQNCNQLISKAAKQFCFSPNDISVITSGSPLTFYDELKAPDGAAYGPQFCLGQYNPGARTKLKGLFLAGQGTLMPGIVGAALSGLVAAGELSDIDLIWNEVRNYR